MSVLSAPLQTEAVAPAPSLGASALPGIWENCPLGVLLLGPGDAATPVVIMDCNPVACLQHGYLREELIGRSVDLLHAVPWSHAMGIEWFEFMRINRHNSGESVHRHRDGSTFSVEYVATHTSVDGRDYVIGIDRLAAIHRPVSVAEERWSIAVDSSGDGVFDWNIEADDCWLSMRWRQLLGEQMSVRRTRRFAELTERIHPEDAEQFQAALDAHLQRRTPVFEAECRLSQPDGSWLWVATRGKALFHANGQAHRMLATTRDITPQKQAEEERRAMETKLFIANRLESIGRLAAGVAHEINTPLQFITDNTRFLGDSFAEIVSAVAALRAATAGTEAATGLVDTNLDYLLKEIPQSLQQTLEGLSRITRIVSSLKEFSHPGPPGSSPANLDEPIKTAISVSRHEWKYVAEITTDFDPDLPAVPCVLDELNQVFINLLVNAAHAVGDAQRQRGKPGERGLITVRTRRDGEWALVEFEDTGTGIPPEHQARIFEPFFTTKGVGKGTGQGLALARAIIVDHHCGSLDFTTEAGKGTTFHIRLPLAGSPAVQKAVHG